MVFNLSEQNSVASLYLSEIRDASIQKDKVRFRANLQKISQILAYELSKQLEYEQKLVETPLGSLDMDLPSEDIVIVPILRAGIAMLHGLLNYFPYAESSFMSTTRLIHKDGTMTVRLDYISSPPVDDRIVILTDPLIATGSTIYKAYKTILEYGQPKAVHVVSAISCIDGIEYIKRLVPNISQWTGAVDQELTAKSLIVPGLGDVDELTFGRKLESDL